MPKLGLTMEEAMIIEWLVDDGADVVADQPILRIETDKTETEVGSPGSGRLHQVGRPGEVFACGVSIGSLLSEGEAPPARAQPTAPLASSTVTASMANSVTAASVVPAALVPGGRVVATPYARSVAGQRGISLAAVRGTGPGGRIVAADVLEAPAAAVAPPFIGIPLLNTERATAVASAAARSLADLLGIDLAQVPVDPIEQRITRDGVAVHVRRLLQQAVALSVTAASPPAASAVHPVMPVAPVTAEAPLLQEPSEIRRMSAMRTTIAKRMTGALQQMAQLTLAMDAEMDPIIADRAARKASGGAAPTFTDYVVAATARALVRHPGVNVQLTDGGIAVLPDIHVGLAVAVPNGLLVPVVRDAAHRSLDDLSAETSRLAAAARSGTISPGELDGGTFSVSALGSYGVDMFTPVINPPNAGILGIGRVRDEVVLRDGQVGVARRLTLSLTWDHRVFDGVPAAEFCRTVCELLANPTQLD